MGREEVTDIHSVGDITWNFNCMDDEWCMMMMKMTKTPTKTNNYKNNPNKNYDNEKNK